MNILNPRELKLRDYQEDFIAKIIESIRKGNKRIIACASTGCHAKGHGILMYDGTIKAVEDIVIGDEVMGSNSQKRTVLNLCRGRQEMRRVVPTIGEPFVVNLDHKINCHVTRHSTLQEKRNETITIRDYENGNNNYRHIRKLRRESVDFTEKDLKLSPYFVGLMIGDGCMVNVSFSFTTGDPELAYWVIDYAKKHGCDSARGTFRKDSYSNISVGFGSNEWGKNSFKNLMQDEGIAGKLHHSKSIPLKYKTGSKQQRLELLAGLMDSDGYLTEKFGEYSTTSYQLAKDVQFLARSLGFSASLLKRAGSYTKDGQKFDALDNYRVFLSGEWESVPFKRTKHLDVAKNRTQKKSKFVTGFKIESLPEDDYYGFTLDGDKLYLDENFIVHHNSGKSKVVSSIVKRALDKRKIDAPRPYSVIVILPRRDLVLQLSQTFTEHGISHGVIMSRERMNLQYPIQVVSVDTYQARLESGRMEFLDADVCIKDEMHMMFTEKKLAIFDRYPLVLSFSATPVAPRKQSLGDFYEEIVYSISMKELVRLGFLVPFEYYAPADFHPDNVPLNVDGDYQESALIDWVDNKLKDGEGRRVLVGDIYDNWSKLASDRKTVIFCGSQAHAKYVRDEFISHGIVTEYMDCNTEADERKRIFDGMTNGNIQVITNVAIVGVGIDIPIVSCVVIARNTNLLQNYHQWAGRGSRPYEGKENCLIIDHTGTILKLGLVEDDTAWSLDGKTTPEQRKKERKEAKKEPKEIKCSKCSFVFIASRTCPMCQHEMVSAGSPIPVHQAELSLINKEAKTKKPTTADKEQFYAELLGYAKSKGYQSGWAWHQVAEKFGTHPHRNVAPLPPSRETLGWITSQNIKRAKGKASKSA